MKERVNIHFSASETNVLFVVLRNMPDMDPDIIDAESEGELMIEASVFFNLMAKLRNKSSLDRTDIVNIAFAVDVAYQALQGKIFAEEKALTELRRYALTINGMHSKLSAYFPMPW